MLFTRTSQYAIQALIYLAMQPPRRRVMHRQIAVVLGVPPAYLAKILMDLAQHHLLISSRGRLGGYQLQPDKQDIRLLQVLRLTEDTDLEHECLLGLKRCADEHACPLHPQWKPVKHQILQRLQQVSIGDLAAAVQRGVYRLSDLPHGYTHP